MDEKEFVDALPSYTTCWHCDQTVDAPIWRVSKFDSKNWLGLNIVSCSTCGNVIIGSAGSSEAAMVEAKSIRLHWMSVLGIEKIG